MTEVTVGTWNLENLFSSGLFAPSPQVYQRKLEGIAATVGARGVDVLAVQEVGDQQAFDDLRDGLGSGWTGHLSTRPDARGIRVGVLTRLPTVGAEEVGAFPPELAPLQANDPPAQTQQEMGRGALRVTVRAEGGPLDVMVAHLKSKLITYPGGRFSPRDEGERARFAAYALYRRAAEAVTVRAFADQMLAGQGQQRRALLVGDMNDGPEAATTQIMQGPPGSEIGTAGALRPDAGDGHRLFNLVPLLPEGQRASRIYRGRGELIDHIFCSRALLQAVTAVAVVSPGPLPSITEVATDRLDEHVSDHAMVVADLTVT